MLFDEIILHRICASSNIWTQLQDFAWARGLLQLVQMFVKIRFEIPMTGFAMLDYLKIFITDSFNKLLARLYEHFQIEDFEMWRAVFFLFGIAVTAILAKVCWWFIEKKLSIFIRRTETAVDDLVLEALGKPVALAIISIGTYGSAIPLFVLFSDNMKLYFNRICLAGFASAIAWAVYRLVSVLDYLLKRLAQRTDNTLDDMIVAVIRRTVKVAIFLLSAMFIGQNILHLNITALLAGAGVAGLAIAFAAQDTIANFFGSVMIILDRPFKLGDRITIAGTDGIVENIGFRSTKIRKLNGHLVTVPNKKLADSEIENISCRQYIKQTTNLTVTYDTSAEKMERAIAILHEIFDNHECCDPKLPPKIYFNAFNEWSLNIQVIVWYHSEDFWKFQEWNHRNNFEILRRFNEEGIDFAFPTNTTYITGDPKRKSGIYIFEENLKNGASIESNK